MQEMPLMPCAYEPPRIYTMEERIAGINKAWARHRDRIFADMDARDAQKKAVLAERHRVYMQRRWGSDTQYKIMMLLRSWVYMAIRNQATVKARRTAQLLGCTVPEFMDYMASQFTEGMSWDNHGEWEIDHIRPCRSFDLRDKEQQIACFHYTNMRPLWAADNRSKSDKWNGGRARDIKHQEQP